jgi:hypothetical protein
MASQAILLTMANKKNFPSQDFDRFIVRLPPGMRERIRVAAEAEDRSMNAEIVARIADSFRSPARESELWKALERRDLLVQQLIDALEKADPEFAKRRARMRSSSAEYWAQAEQEGNETALALKRAVDRINAENNSSEETHTPERDASDARKKPRSRKR